MVDAPVLNLWGLDLATRRCGWTAGDGATRPYAGAWLYDHVGDDLGELLELFDRDLCKLAERFPPHVITYEAPIKMQWDKLLTIRKIYSLGAYLELWARRRGVRVEEADPKALKVRLCGTHKAEKKEMVRMAVRLGINLPDGPGREDAADSFAAWLVGVQHHAKQHLPAWDAALYGGRGLLV